jgi:5,10-methylenetetrahydrofolate reductase
MVHGPCGGVGFDGACEVDGAGPCPFVPAPVTSTARRATPVPLRLTARPLIVADIPVPALDLDALRRTAAAMVAGSGGAIDAALTGDHGDERVQLPPVLRAQALAAEGLAPWVGLNCRDRNRVALEGELAGLATVDGLAAVHCVTGDHTTSGRRPDARPVFDLDSTELTALAAAAGLTVSVAEAPLAPPVDARPARLAAKVRAGAAVAIVNHAGDAAVVADFVAATLASGADPVFLACVPVVVSSASARALLGFAGMATPPGLVDRVLAASDPFRAGVAEAVRYAESLLTITDVSGVDLSGVTVRGEEPTLARAMAEVARALR